MGVTDTQRDDRGAVLPSQIPARGCLRFAIEAVDLGDDSEKSATGCRPTSLLDIIEVPWMVYESELSQS